jgi:hypothetical protein
VGVAVGAGVKVGAGVAVGVGIGLNVGATEGDGMGSSIFFSGFDGSPK